jgi:hypothetical protein
VTAASAATRSLRWAGRHLWLVWWLVGAAGAFVPISSIVASLLRLAWTAFFVFALAATARRSLARAALIVVAFGVAGLIPLFLFPVWMLNARAHPVLHLVRLAAVASLALLLNRWTAPSPVAPEGPGARRVTFRAIGIGVVALLLLFVYAGGKMGWAQHQTRALCAEVAVGGPVAGIDIAAARRGLSVRSVGAPSAARPAVLLAFEGFAFGREYCVVEHADGRVTKARTASLD